VPGPPGAPPNPYSGIILSASYGSNIPPTANNARSYSFNLFCCN